MLGGPVRMGELLWKHIPGNSSAPLQSMRRSDGVKSFTSLKLWWPRGFVLRPQVGQRCPEHLRRAGVPIAADIIW